MSIAVSFTSRRFPHLARLRARLVRWIAGRDIAVVGNVRIEGHVQAGPGCKWVAFNTSFRPVEGSEFTGEIEPS